jgi:hypothetical protein
MSPYHWRDQEVTICHKSNPPAKAVYAVHLSDLRERAWETQLTLTCLQGLVNRDAPCLFLVQDKYDDLWLEWLQERGDVEAVHWLAVDEVLRRFAPWVEGVVITDPDIAASINVATMLAGVRNMLVVSPAGVEQGDPYTWLPAGARDNVVDLRTFHWQADVEAYSWFYGTYWDGLSQRMVAMLDPYDIPLRDYMVAFRIPLIWVSSRYGAEEAAFAEGILLKLPPNIPCLGWPQADCSPDRGLGEHKGVILVNEYAKFQVCSGYERVSRAVSNLTVHSGTTAQFQNKSLALPPLEDKVYMSFIRTDGDGPNFYRECYRILWDDPQHGRFPMGWQLGPTMYDLMPDVLDYYYSHATANDYFVNALTGIGYIHEENYAYMYPSERRAEIWQEYLRLSQIYRERMGLAALTTYHEMSRDKLEALCQIGYVGVFANYHRSFITTLHNQVEEVAGVPVFRACNQASSVESLVADIREWTPKVRPAFIYVSLTNWLTRMEYVESAIKLLAPEYVAVTPEQLVGLYRESK